MLVYRVFVYVGFDSREARGCRQLLDAWLDGDLNGRSWSSDGSFLRLHRWITAGRGGAVRDGDAR
jgi:hypothetical protein